MQPISNQFYDSDEGGTGSSSEDNTVTDELGVYSLSPATCVPYEVLTPVQRLQLENAKLSAEVRTLKGTAVGSISSTTSTAVAGKDPSHSEYRNLGKKFATVSELWVKSTALGHPFPERFRSSGPWNPERFTSNVACEEGIVAELYFFLPASYHDLIGGSTVFKQAVCCLFPLPLILNLTTLKFLKGAKDFRGYLIHHARDEAPVIFSIGSVTREQYAANYDRTGISAITDLLKSPKKPNEQYALYPRILFTNYEVVDTELFGSSAITKVSLFYLSAPVV